MTATQEVCWLGGWVDHILNEVLRILLFLQIDTPSPQPLMGRNEFLYFHLPPSPDRDYRNERGRGGDYDPYNQRRRGPYSGR